MNPFYFSRLVAPVFFSLCFPYLVMSDRPVPGAASFSKVDFNDHIKPILSDRCYRCHGPDADSRKAGLRLDLEESVFSPSAKSRKVPIRKGHPEDSEVWHRIRSEDPDVKMPPPESGLLLTDVEKSLIEEWIRQGAEWKDHWSFIPIGDIALPDEVGRTDASPHSVAENPIDRFILKRIHSLDMDPSPQADRHYLIRRLSFDLTGLPPGPDEVDAFINDRSPEAYSRLVDRLLASEAYAERMAMDWMDLARYGDTQGMHADRERYHWPWRDWVIQAFADNMPYDDFVTWQLAGDLLPDATTLQKLATAFHRNHPVSAEGGIIDEEFRMKYVQDRANTTATAFMGLTLECASCHDHKFDPISQKEYYQLAAFFNNQKEIGMVAEGGGSSGPVLPLPDKETRKKLDGLDQEIRLGFTRLKALRNGLKENCDLEELARTRIVEAPVADAVFPFDGIRSEKIQVKGTIHRVIRNTPIDKIVDDNPVSVASGNPELVEGRMGKGLRFRKEYDLVFLRDVGTFEMNQPFSAGAWIRTEKEGENQSIIGISGSLTEQAWRGWDLFIDEQNRPSIRLISYWPHNYMQLTGQVHLARDTWTHILFTYDGLGRASGMHLYVNGRRTDSDIDYDNLYGSIIHPWGRQDGWTKKPVMVGRSGRFYTGDNGVFSGSIDQIEFFNRFLSSREIAALYREHTGHDPESGNLTMVDDMEHYLIREHQPALKQMNLLRKNLGERMQLFSNVPEVMVMQEMPFRRKSFVLDRGRYDSPKEEVQPGTPLRILPLSNHYSRDRLGLAQWLFDPDHPLTARVTVNRYWQMIFGRGIVDTPQDFGTQGSLPSHPDLLDWLARYFMDSDWNLRNLLRLMVTSRTYQQSSSATPTAMEMDPENIYLARSPSYRWPAEMIRDHALAAGGQLTRQIGGASVKPYQPEGLWIEKTGPGSKYTADSGDRLYRRSLYTYVRRTTPHPAMVTLDAPNRSVCIVKREITNTPLQALVLLNDPQFVEAARVIAQQVLRVADYQQDSLVTLAFKWICGSVPDSDQNQLLQQQYRISLERYRNDPEAAEKLLGVGEFPLDPSLDKIKTAALTMVASTLLNFDQAYMKR